ncbi:MAG: hypothetical protein Q8Q01_04080 [archaeon]|nr:hypothetical protein [archaeon]
MSLLWVSPEKLSGYFFDQLNTAPEVEEHELLDTSCWYVADLLSKYIHSSELLNEGKLEPLTFQLFSALNDPNHKRVRRLADETLFLTGFFYDFVRRRGKGQVDYYHDIGSRAFQALSLAYRDNEELSLALYDISEKHPVFSKMIGDLRAAEMNDSDLVNLVRRWEETHDERYRSLMIKLGYDPLNKIDCN